MAAVSRVVFSFGPPGLDTTKPPSKPPGLPRLGSYCFRATCDVVDEVAGCPIAAVRGYDTSPLIGAATEKACAEACREKARRGGRYACAPAQVVLLRNAPGECSGEVFWVVDERPTRRLV
jgi:hypothetical protein